MEHYWKSDQESRPQGVGHLLHRRQDALHSSQVGVTLNWVFSLKRLLGRYQTFRDAMDICEEMGERGSFLKKFETFEEYDIFHENAKKSKAIDAYCEHGGRFIFWLPYRQDWTIFSSRSKFCFVQGLWRHHRNCECDLLWWWVSFRTGHYVEEKQPQEQQETVLCRHQTRWISCWFFMRKILKDVFSLGE